MAIPVLAWGQENSLNTYSPYTLYGLGDLNTSVSPGVGWRNDFVDPTGKDNGGFDAPFDTRINVANPASLSGLPRRSFTFDVGMTGTNHYLKQNNLSTSFNSFNFSHVTLAFPLAKSLGMAINVSPFSKVGYRIHHDDKEQLADLGVVRYYYTGHGDVNEAKVSLGWQVLPRLSVGAELNYLWGYIDRQYEAEIASFTGSGSYGSVSASTNEQITRVFPALGVQWTAIRKHKSRLTLGMTWRMGGKLNSDFTDYIPSGNVYEDVVRLEEYKTATHMPTRIVAGGWFHRPKWSIGGEYTRENWAKGNAYDEVNKVRYIDVNRLNMGLRWTPNRYDIRGKFSSFFNRMTYKAGFAVGNNYLEFNGVRLNEKSVNLGVEIPFKADNISLISVGLEGGTRGSVKNGLVNEKFFRVRVGLMLFGRDYDYWFEKYKYN